MENTGPKTRRPQSGVIPRSPRLSRTISRASSETGGAKSISPQQSVNQEIQAFSSATPRPSINRATRSATSSPRPSVHQPRSATSSPRSSVHRSRPTSDYRNITKETYKEENSRSVPTSKRSSPQRRLSLDGNEEHHNIINHQSNIAKLFRSSSHSMTVKRLGRSLTGSGGSPSAWALSPGRVLPGPPMTPDSPKVKGVSGVLKYFNKQKKVSTAQEEEFHQYKIMHTRLLQWRFVNAKAEVASATVRRKAEEKLFGVWLNLYKMRYSMAEKRMKVERLKRKIKLLQIVYPELELLIQWEKLEKKNCEAVGRVTRKLSAFSTKLPLVDGATADIVSVFEAMSEAMKVMENIEETIMKFHVQTEKVYNLLSKLIYNVEQNMECFQELEKDITSVMSLEAQEKSLIIHLIQAHKEPEEGQMDCKHHIRRSFRNNDSGFALSMLNVS